VYRGSYLAHGVGSFGDCGEVGGQKDVIVFLQKRKYISKLASIVFLVAQSSKLTYRHKLLLKGLARDGGQAIAETRDLTLQIMILGNTA
jgi:hypothetical protein